jgi:Squalene-hopene cyclase C-terminal domain
VINVAVNLLLAAQNSDGGWGWTKERNSSTECTSLALLALAALNDGTHAIAMRRGLDWLIQRQNEHGNWALSDSVAVPSWATAIAMLALNPWPKYHPQVVKAGKWVLTQEGKKPGLLANLLLALSFQKKPVKLNEDLIGWPWMPGTFSWVEPTSYFLIALKRIRPYLTGTNVDERINQGESMICDRMCKGGGWNYGNSVVYGENLWPYADITAIALIALQNHRDAMENRIGIAALHKMVKEENSGLALSWSAMCYEIYGEDSSYLRALLMREFEATGFLGETKVVALYILALAGGARFFRI